jgi:hypothetical protein
MFYYAHGDRAACLFVFALRLSLGPAVRSRVLKANLLDAVELGDVFCVVIQHSSNHKLMCAFFFLTVLFGSRSSLLQLAFCILCS